MRATDPACSCKRKRENEAMEWYLPILWAGVIGAAVAIYVILDGFDLGIGILFPVTRHEADRDVMMNSVAPFWDGNETWLVLGGVGLFVVFPQAYAVDRKSTGLNCSHVKTSYAG